MTRQCSAVPLVLLPSLFILAALIALAQDQPAAQVKELDGAEIFKNHCASCHGVDARGHGPLAPSLKHRVPDLTLISQQNGGKFPGKRLKQVIEGYTISAHGSREMPVWGPLFNHVENDQDLGPMRLEEVSKYLESIQRKQ